VRIRLIAVAATIAALLSGTGLAISSAAAAPTRTGKPAVSRCGSHPWCNTKLSAAKRAHLLLAAMSPSDRIAVLSGDAAPDVGMPAVKATDGAVGAGGLGSSKYKSTAMPAGIALAAGFDPKLAYRFGKTVGAEVRHRGFDADYGPTVNIMRTPLGGRTFEGYGEDPYLAGQIAVGWVKGLQSEGVMADVKHFAVNNQEGQIGSAPLSGVVGGRLIVNALVSQRALHEIYLPAFRAAVQQGHSATVMCSYNQINGVYACGNRQLLTTILRKQWGFKGFVYSDAGACHEPKQDLAAGTNIDILGTCYTAPELQTSLAIGLVHQSDIDKRAYEVLRTLFAYGFFDHPFWPANPSLDNVAADAAVADQAAEQGAVLLRNRHHMLPLASHRHHTIAVIGAAAKHYISGGGSSQVTPWFRTTALAGIERRAARAGDTVTYASGHRPAAAAALAKRSDVAIVVAADTSSEGEDKVCLSLRPICSGGQATPPNPIASQLGYGNQDALIRKVAAANPHTVVVLETGAPVLTPWRNDVAAILEAWYPGEDGGTAIARLLYGDADPGGRLPATFPRSANQLPTAGSTAQYPGTLNPESPLFLAAHYSEGVMVGYRWYDKHHLVPAYPFGFGLSYTTFRMRSVRGTFGAPPARSSVTLRITNTGHRTGWAVPQAYVGLESLGRPEPVRQLAGFAKVRLAPGQSRTVTIHLDPHAFEYWDTKAGRWRVAPGCKSETIEPAGDYRGTLVASCPSRG
jgi:beta-glucosidase